jgi:hypothetical protein
LPTQELCHGIQCPQDDAACGCQEQWRVCEGAIPHRSGIAYNG